MLFEPTSVPERLALPKSIVPSLTSVGLRLGEVPVCFKLTVGPRVGPRVSLVEVAFGWVWVGFFWLLFFAIKKTRDTHRK